MSVLTNSQLAEAINNCNCSNCETINADVLTELGAGSGIFIVPIGDGRSGVNSTTEGDIYDTLIQISQSEASTVNGLITTDYSIVSQNGFPN